MKNTLRLLAVFLVSAVTGPAQLIVDQVPPSLLAEPGKTNTVHNLPDRPARPTQKRPATLGDRWEKFEAEFGIEKKDSSPVKSSLQSAKYQLDHTTFALHEFVNNVEDLLRFDYGMRDLPTGTGAKSSRGSSGSILLDTFNETRFKSDIDLKLSGRQFVGVKLVLPLGD